MNIEDRIDLFIQNNIKEKRFNSNVKVNKNKILKEGKIKWQQITLRKSTY